MSLKNSAGRNRRILTFATTVAAVALWSTLVLPLILGSSAAAEETASKLCARLVMVEDPGCPYCRRWHAEIGKGYANSSEGKLAPLKEIDRAGAAAMGIDKIVYSPTFILMMGDHEVGRIVGYGGADFFWPKVTALADKAREEGGVSCPM